VTAPIDLKAAARLEMLREGFEPDFPADVLHEVAALHDDAGAPGRSSGVRDLRALLWSSIDNPESRDLDQVEVVELLPNGDCRVLVGIADVDSLVAAGSAIDRHAHRNTTSVYCGVTVFPMLPERLSTDLTSLNEGQDRAAIVIEFVVQADGTLGTPEVYRALVHNVAQLDYPGVGSWLEGHAPMPAKLAARPALEAQLRMQDAAAQRLRQQRHLAGSLELDSIESTPVMKDGQVSDLQIRARNRATQLIENFMIAANTAMAGFLERRGSATIRRVVKEPERWDRIVAVAAALGATLPTAPDSGALSAFLAAQRQADPDHFPDLSLAIVKLMGPGVYVREKAGEQGDGHFGLAVREYSHSTAPNRRYADLITQRLLKGVLTGGAPAYTDAELEALAERCTTMENASRKVERTCRKQIAAQALSHRVGESFDAIVTGANAKGTFVRTLRPPAEGMVVEGEHGMDVGDRVRVKLVGANAERGFIDFARALRLMLLVIGLLAAVSDVTPAQLPTASPSGTVAPGPPQAARTLLAAALLEARATNRSVLTKLGASWCGPCHRFDRLFADTTGVGAIMAAHFVVVSLTVLESADKVALENPGAPDVGRAYGWNSQTQGVPFFFMLTADGRKSGDSNAMPNGGNIGYPESIAEVDAFNTLLTTTAPRMPASDRARVQQFLHRAAGRRSDAAGKPDTQR
jgi:VacB/RNase II family 3'-5' exoribonuclease